MRVDGSRRVQIETCRLYAAGRGNAERLDQLFTRAPTLAALKRALSPDTVLDDDDDRAASALSRQPMDARKAMTTEIAALYPGRVEERPHKYVEGAHYLRVTREGSDAALLFETDPQGRVQEWRIGLPPQVDYVEGCG
mgnify:CR=1 FL=1